MKIPSLLIVIGITLAARTYAAPLEVGAAAPRQTVTLDDGETLNLAKAYENGPILVYFYPKSDTPGCTKQACNLRDHFAALGDAGIAVLGVSGDDVGTQMKFRKKYNLPFHLVADADGKLIEAFGVPARMGMASRQSFLVIDGKIAWRDLKAKPATQAQDALAAIKANQ